jgi:hypothetical protein
MGAVSGSIHVVKEPSEGTIGSSFQLLRSSSRRNCRVYLSPEWLIRIIRSSPDSFCLIPTAGRAAGQIEHHKHAAIAQSFIAKHLGMLHMSRDSPSRGQAPTPRPVGADEAFSTDPLVWSETGSCNHAGFNLSTLLEWSKTGLNDAYLQNN